MATRTRTNRGGRRRGGGRSEPGGPAALVSRVTGMLGGSGRRSGGSGRRGSSQGGGLMSRASGLVRGFKGRGSTSTRRRGRRR